MAMIIISQSQNKCVMAIFKPVLIVIIIGQTVISCYDLYILQVPAQTYWARLVSPST